MNCSQLLPHEPPIPDEDGWDLILEYAVSNMAVAVGFSAYFNSMLENVFGFALPRELSEPMIQGGEFSGAWFNLPALLILMLLSYILVRGVRECGFSSKSISVLL